MARKRTCTPKGRLRGPFDGAPARYHRDHGVMRISALAIAVALATSVILVHTQTTPPPAAAERRASRAGPAAAPALKRNIPYAEAKPILDSLREDLVPPELMTKRPTARQSSWPAWVARREAEIRARVARGDEESVVNLLMFGTSFTAEPRLTDPDIAAAGERTTVSAIIDRRLDDLVTGIRSPGTNERLRFVRRTIEQKGGRPGTAEGKAQTRSYLATI